MESKETVTVEKEVYESVFRVNCNKIAECERLQKQLDIAVKALEEYADENYARAYKRVRIITALLRGETPDEEGLIIQ